MSDLPGKAVIIEHPFRYERHVVAKVVSETPKTLTLRYWDARKGDWKDEESRRKRQAIIVLPGDDAVLMQAVHDELADLSAKLIKSQKSIVTLYHQSVANLGAALPHQRENE